ncbi:MAG: hypothetical protein ISR76_10915 [Planctomycetes bacterium]|nr:hypothetical protein [Planctomycetota bacterium]MBL7009501.1 hypothetical protein [Planctomycetota bacterium]
MRITRFPLFLLPFALFVSCQSSSEEWTADDTGLWDEPALEDSTATSDALERAPEPAPSFQDPSDRDQVAVSIQKRRVLANEYVRQGNEQFARGATKTAYSLYAEAFQLDPQSRDARDGIRRCDALLGGGDWDMDSAEDQLSLSRIRLANQIIKVQGMLEDGDRAMAKGDLATAVFHYNGAELSLRTNPSLAVPSLDYSLVSAKLQQATQALNDSVSADRMAATAAANAAAQAEEVARAEYQQNQVRRLLQEADVHFSNGFYEKSLESLDAVLALSPNNQDALELRDIADQAWFDFKQRRNTTRFRHQWVRTFEELRQLAVPPSSSIEYDRDHWLNTVLKRKPLTSASMAEDADPATAAILEQLDTISVTPRYEELPVEEIADNLAALTRVSFVVSRAVREDVDEDVKTINLVTNKPMQVSRLLRLVESLSGDQLRFVVRNGVVNVLSAQEAAGGYVLHKYEVRDIVRPVRDFVGVDVNLAPSGGLEEVEEEAFERDATILSEDDLLATIQENISPDSWEDNISIENGTLIVRHTPEVQARIAQLLEDLRKSANIMVEIKVRFLKVEDSFLQDIGVDFRGLGDAGEGGLGSNNVFDDFGSTGFGSPGQPGVLGTGNDAGAYFREASDNVNILSRTEHLYDAGLGDEEGLVGSGGLSLQYTWLDDTQLQMVLRAVEKSRRSEVLTEPKLMVYNTQRATLTVANQVSYVGDFDVEIAQAAAIADPIVRVARDGVYLDVRPVVSADRRFTFIDVRPTVATLKRPIPSFQTSLGTGSPVTLQLPELELQKIRTRVLIPDGGTLLLGGMKVIDEQSLESGVPFLNRVPLLSFFFSRKGEYESYKKLLILLTARVIIPAEFEPVPVPGAAR